MAVGKLSADVAGARALMRNGVRRVMRRDGTASAAQLIGELRDGDEICGITNGQFSLIDIIEHVLDQTGPADISVATWTMGIYDVERSMAFVENEKIRSARFLLDPSMFSRKPEIAAILVRGFGEHSFRGVNCHAKFATIRSDSMAVAVRSSMNLNPNNRMENFDLSVSSDVCAFFERITDDLFSAVSEGNRSQASSVFKDILNAEPKKGSIRKAPWWNTG